MLELAPLPPALPPLGEEVRGDETRRELYKRDKERVPKDAEKLFQQRRPFYFPFGPRGSTVSGRQT